jgi:Ni/Fe-hydrogenase subunit HybB-like protein
VASLWLLLGILDEAGSYDAEGAFDVLRWVAVPAAVMASGYTGFLFGQAEGRDLWQSPLLFWHLQVQALMVGAGALAVATPFADVDPAAERLVVRTLVLAAAAHVVVLALEYAGGHATRHAAAAAHMVTSGRYARTFWLGAVALAALAAVVAAVSWGGDGLVAALVAGLLVQVSLVAYESVFVRAGQDVPLS